MTMPVGTEGSYWGSPELQASIAEATAEAEGTVEGPDDQPSEEGSGVEAPAGASPEPSPRAEGEVAAAPDAGTPAAPAADPNAEPEPAFEPFAYTVNGEARTLDGFHRVPGEGVYIPADQEPRLQQIVSRAEASEQALRDMYGRTQAYERASQWTVYGDDGKPQQTLNGVDAIQQMRVDVAKLQAALDVLAAPYRDPQALLGLFTQHPETGALQINPREVQNLITAGQLAQLRAEQRVRQALGSPASAPAPSPGTPTGPSVTLTPEQALPAAQALATSWGIKGLTQEDFQVLAQVLPRYTRAATPADVAQDPLLRVGQPVVENEFQAVAAHQAALRAQQTTAGKAGKFNQGQANGRAGPRPAARPASPQAPAAPAPSNGKARSKPNWDAILERGMQDPDVQAALSGER